MATYGLDAVVIKSRGLGEADDLATLYSHQRGKVRGVARGARKARSRLAAGVQPFTHASFQLWESRGIHGIRQCQVTSSFPALKNDYDRMCHAGYLCRLADLLTTDSDPSPAFFLLLLTSLSLLESLEPVLVRRFFEIRALGVFGFRPQIDACAGCQAGDRRQWWYSPAAGGLVCPRCRDGARAGVDLDPGARMLLETLQRVHPRRLKDVEWSGPGMTGAGRALDLHLVHVIDRPIDTSLLDAWSPGSESPGRT